MVFTDKIRGIMKRKHLNWMVVSRELNLGKNQLKYWEKANSMPDGETLLALADYFDVTVESLMRDDMPLEHIGDVYSQEDPAIFYDVPDKLPDFKESYDLVHKLDLMEYKDFIQKITAPKFDNLSEQEKALIQAFRKADGEQQLRIIQTVMNIKDEVKV